MRKMHKKRELRRRNRAEKKIKRAIDKIKRHAARTSCEKCAIGGTEYCYMRDRLHECPEFWKL